MTVKSPKIAGSTRITVPIFHRIPVPGGRTQDVAAALPPDLAARCLWKPSGKWDYVLHRFTSAEVAAAELENDGYRAPAYMGGDAVGWRKCLITKPFVSHL